MAVYGVLASTYIVHESVTCHGTECFGEGFAWIGLAGGIPVSAAIGAGIGSLWPLRDRTR